MATKTQMTRAEVLSRRKQEADEMLAEGAIDEALYEDVMATIAVDEGDRLIGAVRIDYGEARVSQVPSRPFWSRLKSSGRTTLRRCRDAIRGRSMSGGRYNRKGRRA
jgi:hypothetical protein